MASTKPTDGYHERLMTALSYGPVPMPSVRALARALRDDERYAGMRGTSDAGIRAYAEGNVRRPRTELLRAIADVLQVRAEWLVFGKGEMTEELEQRRGLLAKLDEMREEEAAAFHAAVVRAMRAPSDREPRYWMPAAWEASRRLGLDAKKLGRQLAAPLAALGIDPGRMTEDAFNDHVTRMVSVLLALDGEQKAQAPYRTTKEV